MILRYIGVFLLTVSLSYAQKGVPSRIQFIAVDDGGQRVTHAVVDGCFLDVSQSGARDRFSGRTDTSGCFVATGEALVGVYARFACTGFYAATIRQKLDFGQRIDGNGWDRERWDAAVPVLLKRVKDPTTLIVAQVENIAMRKKSDDRMGLYILNSLVERDLVMGSLLPPYGDGKIGDMGFKWKMTVYSKDSDGLAIDFDTLCEIRFTNAVDGISRGKPDGSEGGQVGSSYISDYEAPLGGYTNAISFYRNVRGGKAESNDDQHYLYYFRIRTQTNELGQVTNALYGKIYGQINGNFTYYLNPTPNDRNVEEIR